MSEKTISEELDPVRKQKHTRARILLIDDEELLRDVWQEALVEEGYDVETVESPEHAFLMLEREHFDLVLLDVQMPGMDGFEVAELMKGNKKTKDVAIIFITAISKEIKYIQKGYDVGAENYLFKPIEPDELKSKVETSLKYRRFKKLGKRTV